MITILLAYMVGMIILTLGVLAGNYTSGLLRQRTMNSVRKDVGLTVKPMNFRYNR